MRRQGNWPPSPISLTDIEERQIRCRVITIQILQILTIAISLSVNWAFSCSRRMNFVFFAALETPILVASKNGIMEMVTKILELFPMAIYDTHKENWKNTVLMAVENRQSHIYDFLLNRKHLLDREIAFHAVDYRRNTALHLAGKLAGYHHRQHIPTSMLQMQWEVKWYQVCKTQAKL